MIKVEDIGKQNPENVGNIELMQIFSNQNQKQQINELNNSPLELFSQAIANNLTNESNKNTIEDHIKQEKLSNKEISPENNNCDPIPDNSSKISSEIENIVKNIANKVINEPDYLTQENNNTIDSKETDESQNIQEETTEISSSEINSSILENITKGQIQKLISEENNNNNNNNDSTKCNQNASALSFSNISDEISEPRTIIRRHFEKSDASVQFESTDDSIFATSIDSPRIEEEMKEKKETNEDNTITEENDEKSGFVPTIPISLYTDEELHSELKNQIKTKKLPPLEMREELIKFAKKQSLIKLMAEEYEAAAKIDEAILQNQQSLRQENVTVDVSYQMSTLKQYLEEAKDQKAIIESNHKQRIDQFKKKEQQMIEEKQKQHEEERKDFEYIWSSEEKMKTFNKPSPKLFQLRRQQKSMAMSHDFKNALELKKMADDLQKEESKKATKKAYHTISTKFVSLLSKQEKEMKCMIEYGERRLTRLQTERDAELKANETHIKALENRIKSPILVKRPRIQVSQQSRSTSKSNQMQFSPILTSRTRSQLVDYRQSVDEKTRLDVKMGDVRRITKRLTDRALKGEKSLFSSSFS